MAELVAYNVRPGMGWTLSFRKEDQMTKRREWIVSVSLACLWACGAPEQSTVDQFFRASQTNDNITLASMSAVGPPVEVQSWEVVEVSSRTTEPYELPGLAGELEVAEKERDAAAEERKKYFDEHQDALEQIIPKLREDPDYKFRGRVGEVQEEWMRLLEERREHERTYQELKRAVDRQTRLANRSVMRQVKLEELQGDIAVTEMLVNVRPRDGNEGLPYKVTLQKYNVSAPESDRPEAARWIIVDIEGTTPEAQAAAAAHAKESGFGSGSEDDTEPSSVAGDEDAAVAVAGDEDAAVAAAGDEGATESQEPAPKEPTHTPRELRGLARVQILTPETKVEGDQVITTIRARNVSRDWITRFTVTEHWYDEQGAAVRSGSRTHQGRFMPNEVIEMELRTRRDPAFYQNQFEFSHANGDVNTTVVGSLPEPTE